MVGPDVKKGTVQEAKPIEPLTEFTLFPDLPGELRSKIWRMSIPPTQRLVRIRSAWLRDNVTAIWKPVCNSKGPALLATSSEARAEALAEAIILKSKTKDAWAIPKYFHLNDDICVRPTKAPGSIL